MAIDCDSDCIVGITIHSTNHCKGGDKHELSAAIVTLSVLNWRVCNATFIVSKLRLKSVTNEDVKGRRGSRTDGQESSRSFGGLEQCCQETSQEGVAVLQELLECTRARIHCSICPTA